MVDVQTWASAASIVAVGLTALGMLSRKIDGVRVELKGDLASLEHRLRGDIAHVDARVDKVDARFDKVDARFDEMDRRFNKLEARFDKLEARGDNLDGRIDRLETRFDVLALRMDEGFGRVQSQLSVLEQRTYDLAARPVPRLAEGGPG